MKIEGPGRSSETKSASKTRAKGGVSGANFRAHLDDIDMDDAQVDSFGGVGGVIGIDTILSVQEAGSSTERSPRRHPSVIKAEDILDRLDELRMGILTGAYDASQLQNLIHLVEMRMESVTNPSLASVLEEIDLRAKVELAKLGY